jgi:hypothetical protein
MPAIILLALYGIVILLYVITCFFIVYHLVNFSVNYAMKIFTLFVFIVLASGLLVSNGLLFFSIDWNYLIYNLIA